MGENDGATPHHFFMFSLTTTTYCYRIAFDNRKPTSKTKKGDSDLFSYYGGGRSQRKANPGSTCSSGDRGGKEVISVGGRETGANQEPKRESVMSGENRIGKGE